MKNDTMFQIRTILIHETTPLFQKRIRLKPETAPLRNIRRKFAKAEKLFSSYLTHQNNQFMKSLTRKSLGLSVLALLLSLTVSAQNITVKGTVSDQNGEPVVGAFVTVQNTTTGTSTDIDGA